MAPRATGLSRAAFQQHWASRHAEVATAIPGLRAYVRHPAVLRDGEPVLAEPHFDALSELDFDDVAAMEAGFASAVYRASVRDDEERFIDRRGGAHGVYARTVLRAGTTPAELLLAWTGAPAAVSHDGPHQRLDALPQRPAPFTRVDILGCADADAALAAAERHPGAARLVARAMPVVARAEREQR
jgi:uncharacterized protein (TIGR02118 family)